MWRSSLFKSIARLPRSSPPLSVRDQIHSFASSAGFCGSNLHLILLQNSGATGAWGSCAEQQGRPSSAEAASAPFSCSLQKERGQKSQSAAAGPPHTEHWCHGHSHFPAGGGKRHGKLELAPAPEPHCASRRTQRKFRHKLVFQTKRRKFGPRKRRNKNIKHDSSASLAMGSHLGTLPPAVFLRTGGMIPQIRCTDRR